MMKKFAALFLALGLCASCSGNKPSQQSSQTENKPSPSGWQALYLANGQIYYGHLTQSKGQFYDLKEVYVIQMIPQGQNQPPKPRLVKFGNEILGQVDQLQVNKDQILFIQDLGEDSKVVQAIGQIKSNKLVSTSESETQTETTPTPPPHKLPVQTNNKVKSPPSTSSTKQPASEGQHGVR